MIRGVIQRNPPPGLRSIFKRQAAGNGSTLDLNFMTGVLPPQVTFTRNSSTGYTDINGQAQTAGVNQPRFTTSGLMFNDAATAGALEKGLVSDMSWFNPVAGTFLVEFIVTTLSAGLNMAISVDDNTGNERFNVRVNNGTGSCLVSDGNVVQATLLLSTVTASTVQKVAFAYAANDFAASRNGNAVVVDTAGTLPTVTSMAIGCRLTSDSLNGFMRRITYWPYRRPNAELQAISP
jgi:hypothetical protein